MEKRHSWPAGHWDWPIPLPFKHGIKCGNRIFLGGQVSMDSSGGVVDPGDMSRQTHTSMANILHVLREFGAGKEDIAKLNTFYVGGSDPDDLHANLSIRAGYFDRPGPASTGIPFNHLAYRDMLTEIEVVAVVDK